MTSLMIKLVVLAVMVLWPLTCASGKVVYRGQVVTSAEWEIEQLKAQLWTKQTVTTNTGQTVTMQFAAGLN